MHSEAELQLAIWYLPFFVRVQGAACLQQVSVHSSVAIYQTCDTLALSDVRRSVTGRLPLAAHCAMQERVCSTACHDHSVANCSLADLVGLATGAAHTVLAATLSKQGTGL